MNNNFEYQLIKDILDIDYYDSTGSVYKTAKIKGSVFRGFNGGLFSQYEDGPVLQNTTSTLDLLGNGEGTMTIPANALQKGGAYELLVTGELSATLNDILTINLESPSAVFCFGGAFTMFQITPPNYFELKMIVIVREIGGVGVAKLEGSGTFQCKVDSGSAYKMYPISFENVTTIDTTASHALELNATWNSAKAGNRIMTRTANWKKIY